jgi:hypothetical protein
VLPAAFEKAPEIAQVVSLFYFILEDTLDQFYRPAVKKTRDDIAQLVLCGLPAGEKWAIEVSPSRSDMS